MLAEALVAITVATRDALELVSLRWGTGAGGYGAGAVEYASLSMLQGAVTDSDIDAAIAGVMPVAAIAWTFVIMAVLEVTVSVLDSRLLSGRRTGEMQFTDQSAVVTGFCESIG